MSYKTVVIFVVALIVSSCEDGPGAVYGEPFEAVIAQFGDALPVEPPLSYESKAPQYIQKDVRNGQAIDDKRATLGRVLFYDKSLSDNGTIACASCHQQAHGFSDTAQRSIGLNGEVTSRHSMRLVNNRFAIEQRMFWD